MSINMFLLFVLVSAISQSVFSEDYNDARDDEENLETSTSAGFTVAYFPSSVGIFGLILIIISILISVVCIAHFLFMTLLHNVQDHAQKRTSPNIH